MGVAGEFCKRSSHFFLLLSALCRQSVPDAPKREYARTREGAGHTPEREGCPGARGGRRGTGPMSAGHFGGWGAGRQRERAEDAERAGPMSEGADARAGGSVAKTLRGICNGNATGNACGVAGKELIFAAKSKRYEKNGSDSRVAGIVYRR